jgi:DNA-binding transcriptional LysR family regulator
MELSMLKVFIAVAENGGVSSAADQLNYVQSNVTARIKKLEDELDVSLFKRQNRGMVLSDHGSVLLEYAYKIVDLERQAVQAVGASLQDGGKLSLGSMETAMAVRLPRLLKEFHKRQPKTELSVCTGTTDEMIAQVINHKLDCAIVGSRVENDEITELPFFKETLVVVSPKGGEKLNTLLVYRKGCAYRARAEQWLREMGRLPYTIMELGTQEGIIGCIVAGIGISVMPLEVAKNLGEEVEISALPASIADVETYLIFRNDSLQSRPMQTLVSLVSGAIEELAA